MSTDASPLNMSLDFNHPIKELIWVNQKSDNITEKTSAWSTLADPALTTNKSNKDYFNYSADTNASDSTNTEYINGQKSYEGFNTAKLRLNGHDRFAERKASYFRLCQPLQAGHKIPEKHIYCYSFALKPEEHQPSGSCNFSRIDNAKLMFKNVSKGDSTATITCYAINYNVLRIMSGMGGLAYSN